jgi:uncharacterized protein YecE (DUF72 family)
VSDNQNGIRVGLSGWSYPAWRSGFYKDVPQRRWLAHCAAHFNTIEVNATYYRMLKPANYARWYDETPDGFVFAIKGNRVITHLRLLKDPAAPIAAQKDNSAALGDKLRVVLWQLPARLRKDIGRLSGFARELAVWSGVRHAIEFRHGTWFDDETAGLLAKHKLAICVSDAADWPRWDRVSTDFVYVRLHGAVRTYHSRYDDEELESWARRIKAWRDESRVVYVYFDNDAEGHAPYDAMRLMALLDVERPLPQAAGAA